MSQYQPYNQRGQGNVPNQGAQNQSQQRGPTSNLPTNVTNINT